MSEHHFRDAISAALGDGRPAAELDRVIEQAFPDLSVFREEDDLVIVAGETRRLLVRRVGPNLFRLSENAAASGSTNLLDAGGGQERDLDGLVEEIRAFAAI
ncbi:hypothetical protein [Enterovirga aerilata]|uniref:Uncharacterized protein n=1 Tax=Enterovirga aerilata TaxID=2730920 RepID=A0A849I7R3_9HYPH|nr:hypothetical protein [Enterovirga sp. DB1703]NNM73341.1 hypothetical protein [Enterovirga sp. DB1703]